VGGVDGWGERERGSVVWREIEMVCDGVERGWEVKDT